MTLHYRNFNFLDLDEALSDRKKARVLILPVPYDQTSSYKGGSREAPFHAITASHYVETYDEDLGLEPCEIGRASCRERV